jgi:Condensation domain
LKTNRYADFASWQKEQHSTSEYNTHVKYWLTALSGELPSLDLPTDHPRPPNPSRRGGVVHFAIPPQLSVELNDLARTYHCTMFMVLLATYQALLRKYTGQEDIIIGTAIANRGYSIAIQQLIGFFVNTLALRTVVSEDAPFVKLLDSVRTSAISGFEHQDVPFDDVVTQLGVHRSLAMHPVYQAFFVLQGLPGMKEFCGFPTSPITLSSETEARFDLTLEICEEHSGGFGCSLEFARDLFDEATVQRMAGHFINLIGSILKVETSLSLFKPLTLFKGPCHTNFFAKYDGRSREKHSLAHLERNISSLS